MNLTIHVSRTKCQWIFGRCSQTLVSLGRQVLMSQPPPSRPPPALHRALPAEGTGAGRPGCRAGASSPPFFGAGSLKLWDSYIWRFLHSVPQLGALSHHFFGGRFGSPTKIDCRKRGTLLLTSLLEDVVRGFERTNPGLSTECATFREFGGVKRKKHSNNLCVCVCVSGVPNSQWWSLTGLVHKDSEPFVATAILGRLGPGT